jgi:replicative DNA helicase
VLALLCRAQFGGVSVDREGYPSPPPDPPALNTGVAPPHSIEAEEAVLGGILLSDRAIPGMLQEGLAAEHFYRDRHRAVYAAMLALHEQGAAVDVLTVTVELEQHGKLEAIGGRAAVDALTGGVPGLGGIRRYARIVIEHWQARQVLAATYTMQAGVLNHDAAMVEDGRRMLDDTVVAPGVTDGFLGKDALGSHMLDWMGQPAVEGLPMPVELPSVGRMVRPQPGDLMLVAAWPSGGKSSMVLAMAETLGRRGHRTVMWANDDTPQDIAARHVQGLTGIPSDRIVERRLNAGEMRRVVAEFSRMPFELQPADGWTAEQVVAHIRQVRPDVAIVDHFHALSGLGKVAEIDEAVKALKAVALQTGCLLIVAAQCNRNRLVGVCKPPPVLADLRGSASFEFASTTIVLAHIDEEEIDDLEHGRTGEARQLDRGSINVARNKRGGRRGVVRVVVDREHVRFVEPARGRDYTEPVAGPVEAEGF